MPCGRTLIATTGSICWSRTNGDRFACLLNEDGRLIDHSTSAGTAERLGQWNALAGRDLDNDGDIDFVAANLGLNTKYHASPERPTLLYYGDLDGSGKKQLVEAEFERETLYPVRGRSCSSNAMPSLASKFPTFESFALASLSEIYESPRLEHGHETGRDDVGVLRPDQRWQRTF